MRRLFWMFKRGVADAKIRVLAKGRDLFEGIYQSSVVS
jgi:hypothetical protein